MSLLSRFRPLSSHISKRFFASTVKFNFTKSDGTLIKSVEAALGRNLLDVAHAHDIDIEGACGGQEGFSPFSPLHCLPLLSKKAVPEADEDEMDMLDLAMDVEEGSRLGCQVKVVQEMAGMNLRLPVNVVNQLD